MKKHAWALITLVHILLLSGLFFFNQPAINLELIIFSIPIDFLNGNQSYDFHWAEYASWAYFGIMLFLHTYALVHLLYYRNQVRQYVYYMSGLAMLGTLLAPFLIFNWMFSLSLPMHAILIGSIAILFFMYWSMERKVSVALGLIFLIIQLSIDTLTFINLKQVTCTARFPYEGPSTHLVASTPEEKKTYGDKIPLQSRKYNKCLKDFSTIQAITDVMTARYGLFPVSDD